MYCLQLNNARLGNFINLTPTLQSLAEYYGYKVPTYFETNYVRQCFLDAPFLQILQSKPTEDPLITSTAYKRDIYSEPDYKYIWNKYNKLYGFRAEMPHTYVDSPALSGMADLFGRFFVVSNGSGFYDGKYEHLKVIDKAVFNSLINEVPMRSVFVGSKEDQPHAPKCDYYFTGDIRASLALIARASFVLTCDGGMMHAAAAMRKPMFVLWKNTNSIKSCPPFGYICKDNYRSEFLHWLKQGHAVDGWWYDHPTGDVPGIADQLKRHIDDAHDDLASR